MLRILPEKDVDGFHPYNVGLLSIGKADLKACTPAGCIELIKRSGVDITSKNCVVVGRSNIVGKPVGMLLLAENGTVTTCHSKTKDIKAVCQEADIIVAAVGIPKFVKGDMVKEGVVVIDVGINRMDNGKLCGDVDFDEVEKKASYITPVPGGVGPMTIAVTSILGINPLPYLITQILASNIGGTATLIGDPPNIMIGSAAELSFNDFIVNTGIPAVIIAFFTIFSFYFIYGRKLKVVPEKMQAVMELDEKKAIKDKVLLIESVIIMAFVVLAFIFHDALGIQSATIAIAAAAVILLLNRSKVDPEEIISTIEWPTIVFFVGLFGVVGGLQQTGVIDMMAQFLLEVTKGNDTLMLLLILWVSAILSSFLDNIPFVATLIPLIITMGNSGMDVAPLWWALSLGACLGGNGTLVGASRH